MSNLWFHTPEELQKLAEEDYEKFYQIAKEYYHKNSSYYSKYVRPLLNKLNEEKKNNENIANSNSPTSSIHTESKLRNKDDWETESGKYILNKNKKVFCTKCGSENKIDSNFCFSCGNRLDDNKSGKHKDSLGNSHDEFDLNTLSKEKRNIPHEYVPEDLMTKSDSTFWLPLGFVSAIVSIFFFPIPFGLFGAFCGYKGTKNGQEGGGAFIIILSLLCAAIGVIYGIKSVTK